MEKLLVVEVPKREVKLVIKGDVVIEKDEDSTIEDKDVLIHLDFNEIKIETPDGKDYEVTGSTWAGHRFDKFDVVDSIVKALILDNGDAKASYIAPVIQSYIDAFRSHVVLEQNGKKVLKYLPHSISFGELNILYVITNKYVYYTYTYESTIVYDIDDMSILTDIDDFAFNSLCESLVAIKNGKEELLYAENKEELDEIDLEDYEDED